MTTALPKKDGHKEARAITPGFFELINTFSLTPRQGLANKRTSFISVVKHHNNNSTSFGNLASTQAQKPTSVWLSTRSQAGDM